MVLGVKLPLTFDITTWTVRLKDIVESRTGLEAQSEGETHRQREGDTDRGRDTKRAPCTLSVLSIKKIGRQLFVVLRLTQKRVDKC